MRKSYFSQKYRSLKEENNYAMLNINFKIKKNVKNGTN